MVTVSVSDRQAAEIVTDLGKGMSAVQVASRKHVPTAVVEMLKEQHGPAPAVLRAAGKRLHAALRADPVEDLEPGTVLIVGETGEPESDVASLTDQQIAELEAWLIITEPATDAGHIRLIGQG